MGGRLTLVAGSGSLVPPVARAARRRFEEVQVIDLYGRGDIEASRVTALPVSEGPAIIAAMKSFRTTHLALVGAVRLSDADREGIARTLGIAGKLGRSFGDIGLAGMGLVYTRMMGIRLVGAHDVAPDLLAPEGRIAGPEVAGEDLSPVRLAFAGARAIGSIDLGQSIVYSGRRPVAAEDAEGTDALLARVEAMHRNGLVGTGGHALILAKAVKPKQPRFVDLPAIGPQTIANAAAAGISIVAVEAKRTLLLERDELQPEAESRGVSVLGLRHG
jgi:DUF1009 family protein